MLTEASIRNLAPALPGLTIKSITRYILGAGEMLIDARDVGGFRLITPHLG